MSDIQALDKEPLAPGFRLAERYEIGRLLGASENSLSYLGRDTAFDRLVKIKEFIPKDSMRIGTSIQIPSGAHDRRVRVLIDTQFRHRSNRSDIVTQIAENGTVYRISSFVQGSELKPQISIAKALKVLEAVEQLHLNGLSHSNLRPSNIIQTTDQINLVDTLNPEAWERVDDDLYRFQADSEIQADLLSLIAIFEHLGLRMPDPHWIPFSVAELRRWILRQQPEPRLTISEIDEVLTRAAKLRPNRRECPACNGILVVAHPLKKDRCPICREGQVRKLDLVPDLCPCCRTAKLNSIQNSNPLAICPTCKIGSLSIRKRMFFLQTPIVSCSNCFETFETNGELMRRVSTNIVSNDWISVDEWRSNSGRSVHLKSCPNCSSQFDQQLDNRWKRIVPSESELPETLYEEEWLRLANGLPIWFGNARCTTCDADFNRDSESLTLLSTPKDPFGVASTFLGRRIPLESVPWRAIGKHHNAPGLICESCTLEFDDAKDGLSLVHASTENLAHHTYQVHSLMDWHRTAQGCPTIADEPLLINSLKELATEEFRSGRLLFDQAKKIRWKGNVLRENGKESTLTLTENSLEIGGPIRKMRIDLNDILNVDIDEECLTLVTNNGAMRLWPEPIEITLKFESGRQLIQLTPADLAEMLRPG